MPINKKEILSIVTQITQDKKVRANDEASIGEFIKGGFITGAIAATAALLRGRESAPAGVWYSWVVNSFHKSWEYI